VKKIVTSKAYASAYVRTATVATAITTIVVITGAGRKFH
jgi:hypothetical protein